MYIYVVLEVIMKGNISYYKFYGKWVGYLFFFIFMDMKMCGLNYNM